jgi:lipopolysaccharide biosynthesis glycosyltransferase
MASRTLIFSLVLHKPKFKRFFRCFVDSLRTFGKYNGAVTVFTNFEDLETINEHKIVVTNDLYRNDFRNLMKLKAQTINHFDFSQFDKIMYCDCDQLVIGDINPILDLVKEKVLVSTEPKNMGFRISDEKWTDINDLLLINAGNVVGKYDKFHKALSLWQKYNNLLYKNCKKTNDQDVLNWMVYTGILDVGLIPRNLIGYPLKPYGKKNIRNAALLHFNGTNKENKLIKAFNDLMERGIQYMFEQL